MNASNRQKLWDLLRTPRLVLLVCLTIHLLWFIGYRPWQDELRRLLYDPPNSDTRSYHRVAITLMRYWDQPGTLLETLPDQPAVAHALTNRPLGYPLLMVLIYNIFGIRPMFVLMVQVVLSVAGCWLLMRAVEILFGAQRAVFAGWFYALNPLLPEHSCQMLSEIPFLFLITLNLWLVARFYRQIREAGSCYLWVFLLGVGMGLAGSVRASMLYLAILPLLYWLFARRAWRERVLQACLYGLGIALIIGPWLIYNRVHYHTWRLTLSGEIHLFHMVAYIEGGGIKPSQARRPLFERIFERMRQDGLDPYRDLFERGRYYRAMVWEYVQRNPARVLQQVARGVYGFWFNAGFPYTAPSVPEKVLSVWFKGYHIIYLLLLSVGFIWMARQHESRWYLGIFVITALYFTLTAGWAGHARYRLQVFPLSLPVVASGMALLGQWRAERLSRESGNE